MCLLYRRLNLGQAGKIDEKWHIRSDVHLHERQRVGAGMDQWVILKRCEPTKQMPLHVPMRHGARSPIINNLSRENPLLAAKSVAFCVEFKGGSVRPVYTQ